MIMENLIFVGIVFAIAVILYSVWQLVDARRNASRRNAVADKPFPPFKRTISGADPVEQAQIQFQQRIEHWQRTQMPRWSGLRNSADALTGEKYTYVPGPSERTNGHGGLRDVGRPRQQFELVG
jgi:hypothetical protein